MRLFRKRILRDENGVVLVLVALLLFVFLGVAALAIDISIIHLAKNELQKAADAGALAGARDLYLANGAAVNTNTNNIALGVAAANNTLGGVSVEVRPEEVERGHWSFGLGNLPRGFYPNNSTSATILANFSEVELDENLNFINAVRVIARRQTTLAPAFFSRIFNYSGFQVSAEAVAYLGYAGNLDEDEVEYPLAICEDSILQGGDSVDCTVGTYLSGVNQTSRWTNFIQPCSGAANAASVMALMNPCGRGNPDPIFFGQGVTTMRGTQASSGFAGPHNITDCWKASDTTPQMVPRAGPGNTRPYPNDPWEIKLLVIDCNDPSQTCKTVTGVVSVNVLWITTPNEHAQRYVPVEMSGVPGFADWAPVTFNSDPLARWNDFASHFNLLNPDGTTASYEPFTLYFHQNCTYIEPTGGTGGVNYGVMAKIPVLVQ